VSSLYGHAYPPQTDRAALAHHTPRRDLRLDSCICRAPEAHWHGKPLSGRDACTERTAVRSADVKRRGSSRLFADATRKGTRSRGSALLADRQRSPRDGKTLSNVEGARIKDQNVLIEDDYIKGYKVNVEVTFVLEDYFPPSDQAGVKLPRLFSASKTARAWRRVRMGRRVRTGQNWEPGDAV
jgi:flavin-binding protein dodecin